MLILGHRVLLSLSIFLFLMASCAPRLSLQRPFVVLHFADIDLVVERETSIEAAVPLPEGNLRFDRIQESAHFKAEGSGTFIVKGRAFRYLAGSLSCDCGEFDKSMGALLIRGDGSLVPVNLLSLLAR